MRVKVIFFLILVFLICLLSLPLKVSRNIKTKLVDISYPLLKTSNYIIRKISFLKNQIGEVFIAVRENRNLREKVDKFSEETNQLKESLLENERLQKLLDIKKALPYETIACRVIGRDASSWYKTIIIDKGIEDGITTDSGIIGISSVAGRVVSCGQRTSTVLLITDTGSSLAGMIQDTRVNGLVEGKGQEGCILNYIPKKADVPIGGMVVTSGLSTIFPKGLLIGRITEVTLDSQGLYKIAKLELSVDIDRLEEVLVSRNQ